MIVAAVILCAFTVLAESQDAQGNRSPEKTSSGLDMGPLWLYKRYEITCCLGGTPYYENPELIRNWTSKVELPAQVADSNIPLESPLDHSSPEDNCRRWSGTYALSVASFFSGLNAYVEAIACKCPDIGRKQSLDRNCRRLSPCQNEGNRSFSTLRCICPDPYFGDNCEKYCDQGQRMKDASGRDYCSCVPFYQGEECREMVCLNGGTHVKHRCVCPPNFLGYHCEIDTARASGIPRYQRYDDQGNDLFTRDVSGTIFSLIMIIVLVVSMYLLMKHRMQVQSRFATIRRDELSRSAQGAMSRRSDLLSPEGARILSYRAAPVLDGGPPPYLSNPQRGFMRRQEVLPPLPSYEDATKLPPLARPNLAETTNSEEGGLQIQETPEISLVESSAEEPQPSTSSADAQTAVFTAERQRLERSTSSRRSI